MLNNLKTITVCPNNEITDKEFSEDCKRRKAEYEEKIMQKRMAAQGYDLQLTKRKELPYAM